MEESGELTEDSQRLSVLIPFVRRDYVLNGIYLWSGSIASIPGTFRLCDGTLGTPDLRDSFVPGAGDSYVPDAGGGSINHNHTFTGDGHEHTVPADTDIAAGTDFDDLLTTGLSIGTTNNADKRPPYHSLAYIMYAGRVH